MRTLLQAVQSAALICLFAIAAPASGHPGHGAAISREAAIQRGSAEISRLVSAGKLEASWKAAATVQSAELRESGRAKEWKLTFANAQASKESERTLYVFLSEIGEYLAANFTGK
jgi:hypothetical protein